MGETNLREIPNNHGQPEVERSGYNGSTVNIPALWAGNPNINLTASFDVNSAPAKIYNNFRDSVAHILVNDGVNSQGSQVTTDGTGFFVTKSGMLATDYHVIKDAAQSDPNAVQVQTSDGQTHTARIVNVDTADDLALLQVNAPAGENFHPVNLSQTGLQQNDLVTTLGFPKNSNVLHVSASDNSQPTTLGNFSVQGGLYPGETPQQQVYASDMNVAQGNSGGPLFDSSGRVIGIIDLTNESNLAVSTPVQPLLALLNKTASGAGGYYYSSPNFYSGQANPFATAFQGNDQAPNYYQAQQSQPGFTGSNGSLGAAAYNPPTQFTWQ